MFGSFSFKSKLLCLAVVCAFGAGRMHAANLVEPITLGERERRTRHSDDC